MYLFRKCIFNHPLLHVQCISKIFWLQEYCYFRGVLTVIDFEWTVSISRVTSSFYLGYCVCLKQTLVIPPFKGIDELSTWFAGIRSLKDPNYIVEIVCHQEKQGMLLQIKLYPLNKQKKGSLFYYKIVVAIHSFKFNFFFRMEVSARWYHSFQLNYQLWYLLGCMHVFIRRVVCLITSFTIIHFFYGTVIIPRQYCKQTIRSSALCLFSNNFSHPFC